MDLKQRKLTKSEWESIEMPVNANELEILKLISEGYHNVNIKYNKHDSLFTYLKIDYSECMEEYLYNKYFSDIIQKWFSEYNVNITIPIKSNINIKKADQIRLAKIDTNQNILINTPKKEKLVVKSGLDLDPEIEKETEQETELEVDEVNADLDADEIDTEKDLETEKDEDHELDEEVEYEEENLELNSVVKKELLRKIVFNLDSI
jgi:hypothetical protein